MPFVLHSHFAPSAEPPRSLYPDQTIFGGELDRIYQHITKHLLDPGRIGAIKAPASQSSVSKRNVFFTHLRAATVAYVYQEKQVINQISIDHLGRTVQSSVALEAATVVNVFQAFQPIARISA